MPRRVAGWLTILRIDHPAARPGASARLRGSAGRGDTATLYCLRVIFSEYRYPPRDPGAGRLFGIMRQARSGADMKVNIEIDCTPLEARQFFGLPDVQPMQMAVMDKLQQQMMSNIDKVSPESLIQSWFSFDPKLAERMQDMFVTMTGLGTLASDKKK
jgi:Family of unknown function (DUF6489)